MKIPQCMWEECASDKSRSIVFLHVRRGNFNEWRNVLTCLFEIWHSTSGLCGMCVVVMPWFVVHRFDFHYH